MLQINASIVLHQGEIWCAYRTTHLFAFDSKPYLSHLDIELNVVSNKKLLLENGNTAFEDIRLFSIGDTLLAFYTYMPFDTTLGWQWKFGVGFGFVDLQKGLIVNPTSLRHLSTRPAEKNWVPYLYQEEVFLITDFEPYLRIIKIGLKNPVHDTNQIYFSAQRTIGWAYGELRGGTPLVSNKLKNDDWLYGFVHSHLNNVNGFSRFYYYTIVRFNPVTKHIDFHPDPLPYYDEEPDAEYLKLWQQSNKRTLKVIFPMGIIDNGEGVTVSFGKDDVCSYTQFFTWDFISSLFER